MISWHIQEDIDEILTQGEIPWDELKEARILLAGGTGYLGQWLLQTLCSANRVFRLGLVIDVLSRNPERFRQCSPQLANDPATRLIRCDITEKVPQKHYTHIIHSAADMADALHPEKSLSLFKTIVTGTSRLLDLAAKHQDSRFLFISSGAVYGPQTDSTTGISEASPFAPLPLTLNHTYALAKRSAETLCALHREVSTPNIVIARLFSFIGPLLPLNAHFAAGAFIKMALENGCVDIAGDGKAIRSYLYPTDLAIWLMHILLKPSQSWIFNLGSEQAVPIKTLAQAIADHFGNGQIKVHGGQHQSLGTNYYVPNCTRIKSEFSLQERVSFAESLIRTKNRMVKTC